MPRAGPEAGLAHRRPRGGRGARLYVLGDATGTEGQNAAVEYRLSSAWTLSAARLAHLVAHPAAGAVESPTLFDSSTAAGLEAERRLALQGVEREL